MRKKKPHTTHTKQKEKNSKKRNSISNTHKLTNSLTDTEREGGGGVGERERRGKGCFFQFVVDCVKIQIKSLKDNTIQKERERKRGEKGGKQTKKREKEKKVIWLILPVDICLSQRLSHASVSASSEKEGGLRKAH